MRILQRLSTFTLSVALVAAALVVSFALPLPAQAHNERRMNTPVTLYGIPNCDTVKRARAWLAAQGVEHHFHDFKKAGVPEAGLQRWLAAAGWTVLLNRRGTAWRALPEPTQASVADAGSAAAVMHAHPSVIKRPVVQWPDGGITVGFDEAAWAERIRKL